MTYLTRGGRGGPGTAFQVLLFSLLIVGAGCSPPSDTGEDADQDTDADSAVDGDADVDSDVDGDADADGDDDAEIDGGGDGDGDVDEDLASDADAETDADAVEDADLDEDDEVDADADEETPDLTDADGDGFTVHDGDCDDNNVRIYPGSVTPVPDRDYDCDGLVEWHVVITVSSDDEYDLCADGADIGSGASHRDAETWTVELTAGDHVIGIHGRDTAGVTAAMAAQIYAAGRVFTTYGVREGDADTTRWRYFPEEAGAPQVSWCDVAFDDTEWGPALLNDEMDDGPWLEGPIGLQGREVDWIWDGRPRSLRDSWFRFRFTLPEAEPEIPDPPAAECTIVATTALEPTTQRLHNGVAIAWDGANIAALADTWSNPFDSGADELFIHPLTTALVPVAERSMVNQTGGSRRFWWNTHPDIASSPAGFGVVWEDGRHDRDTDQIYFRMVTTEGPGDSVELRVTNTSAQAKYPDLIWDGTGFAAVWQDERDGQREIYGARISPEGAIVGAEVRISESFGASRTPTIAFDDESSQYGVAWQDSLDALPGDGNREIYFQLLDSDFAIAGALVRVTDEIQFSGQPDLAFNGEVFGIAWADERAGNREIHFATMTPAGVVGGAVRVTSSGGVSGDPVLVATDAGWAVAFTDDRHGSEDVYLVQLELEGAPVGDPCNVTSSLGRSRRPDLVAVDGDFAVVWEEEADPAGAASRMYPYLAVVEVP